MMYLGRVLLSFSLISLFCSAAENVGGSHVESDPNVAIATNSDSFSDLEGVYLETKWKFNMLHGGDGTQSRNMSTLAQKGSQLSKFLTQQFEVLKNLRKATSSAQVSHADGFETQNAALQKSIDEITKDSDFTMYYSTSFMSHQINSRKLHQRYKELAAFGIGQAKMLLKLSEQLKSIQNCQANQKSNHKKIDKISEADWALLKTKQVDESAKVRAEHGGEGNLESNAFVLATQWNQILKIQNLQQKVIEEMKAKIETQLSCNHK